MKSGTICDAQECAALQPSGSRSAPLAGNYYLWLSSSPPTHHWLNSGKKKSGDPSFMQIYLPKMTHLAGWRVFITSVRRWCSLDKGRVSASIPDLNWDDGRPSYRGHFRAVARPTFILFEGPDVNSGADWSFRLVRKLPSDATRLWFAFFSTFSPSLCAQSECKVSAAADRVAWPSQLAASHLLLLPLDWVTLQMAGGAYVAIMDQNESQEAPGSNYRQNKLHFHSFN